MATGGQVSSVRSCQECSASRHRQKGECSDARAESARARERLLLLYRLVPGVLTRRETPTRAEGESSRVRAGQGQQ